ncbi:MAG: VWA domain-containing protein, partial [Rubritalea sp.]|uniref:VWA domain-containing protein n=1 Tax=Rubritalea sp. TaxID=2109375 RepID=UPI0032428C14
MHFLTPEWLYALVLIPLLAILAILARRSQTRAWKSLIAPRLAGKLINKAPSVRHWIALSLALLSFACIIIALARPYQGEHTTHEKIQSRNILVAIDTSKSMLCEDVSSNRLTAAKSLSLQMLERFPTDRIGVLIFAGSCNVIAPLTVDHIAVQDTISQLDTNSIPVGGSNLADAVALGVETLKTTGKRANALVIFSDGEEHDSGIEEAIEKANEAGVQIITIGVGTPSGGIIPSGKESDGKHRNTKGEVVHTKLHESLLQELAKKTNGAYTSVNNRPDAVITSAINKMESFEQEGRAQIIPHERYYWFVIPAVGFALSSAFVRARWRKGQSAALMLTSGFLTLSPSRVEAQGSWLEQQKHNLFTSPADEKRGYEALKQKKYTDAIEAFKSARKHTSGEKHAQLSSALGQAFYRSGDYKAASKAFSDAMLSDQKSTQTEAEYNLGNSLYQEQWDAFGDMGESTLKEYLTKRLEASEDEEKITREDLDDYEKAFNNALEKFQASQQPNSKQNAKACKEVVKTIQEIRKELQQQQKKEEEDQKKGGDQGKEGDQKKDGDQGKQGDQKKDGDQGKQGDQKKDGDQGKEGDQKKDGDQGKEGDQKKDGDQGKQGDQKKDGDQGKDGDQKKDGDQ